MGKMIYPDGTERHGYFQDNVYKGPNKPQEKEQDFVNPKLLSRPSFVYKKTMKGDQN